MTSQLVLQCNRNGIIEMLEWIIECETTPPQLGLNELINSWEGCAPSPPAQDDFPAPVYTEAENVAVRQVCFAVDAFCEATPWSIDYQAEAIALPEWSAVIEAVKRAHSLMMQRGRLSECEELPL